MGNVVIRLKEALNKRGITQKQLAYMLEVREATISDLIHTKTSINKELLAKIATVLNITDIRELVTFEDKKQA